MFHFILDQNFVESKDMNPRKFYNYSLKSFFACFCRSLIEVIIVKLKNSQKHLNMVTSNECLNFIKRYQPVGSTNQDYMIKSIRPKSVEIKLVTFFTSGHFV